MTNINNERAKFEAWAKVNAPYLNLRRPQHDERGFYWQETETQFTAFQAGLRAKLDKVVSVPEVATMNDGRIRGIVEPVLTGWVCGWNDCRKAMISALQESA